MKTSIIFIFSLLLTTSILAQDITGKWNGLLKVPGVELIIVFNIAKTENGYSATMDSPDQGAFDIPVSTITFENNQLYLKINNANIEYKGKYFQNNFEGTFFQGQEFPLNLNREQLKKTELIRSQDPQKPYPYRVEEVAFANQKAGIKLAGTLTLPKMAGKFPAVVLISGSGPQNRNEEVFGHKPFLVLADHLTRHGIAVLRFDDRGIGQSEGDFNLATSVDFASDVESAVAFLRTRGEINTKKIGLAGHSEGGLIAPMVAANNKNIAFIVLMAGPGMSGKALLPLQMELIAKASDTSQSEIEKNKKINSALFELINTTDTEEEQLKKLKHYFDHEVDPADLPKELTNPELLNGQLKQLATPWMRYFITYDPLPKLSKVTCPVLAINGEKDLQVPPKENLSAIKTTLEKADNNKVSIIEFKGLNHLFQECQTGSPMEYGKIEQTISPLALTAISQWIVDQTK